MRRSLNIHATTSQNVTLDSLMLKVFQSMARKKDSGLTSDDIIVAMRRQNPYKFISNDVYDLIHSALGTEGVDVTSFRNFAARIISENVENYLNEYMEALQINADCGDDILDRFTSTTADMLSKRRSRRCSCCNLL
uniref:CULLIN_2 domain-containing protein n=1 Tax=Macrostomum lignano TaxID=282301 RepID=A0A1I8HIU8_9PLAT